MEAAAQARREFSGALKNLPTFTANRQKGKTWRTHRASFSNWMILHAIPDLVGVDHIKRALLLSLHGPAAQATDLHGPDTPTYAAAGTIEAYLDLIQQVFQPASESAMARLDFEQRTQSSKEPISEYIADKTALYLRNHLLRGVHSNFVKGEVVRADPQDTATLYEACMRVVGQGRESFHLGAGNIANLDGLASTTTISRYARPNDGVEDMEINKIEENRNCYKCGTQGHLAAKCRKKSDTRNDRKTNRDNKEKTDDKTLPTCHYCKKVGHKKPKCRKFEKDYKKKSEKIKKTTDDGGSSGSDDEEFGAGGALEAIYEPVEENH